jgi:UDP-N-acetylglucosamine:LPS N-acetylglucosamine transferase
MAYYFFESHELTKLTLLIALFSCDPSFYQTRYSSPWNNNKQKMDHHDSHSTNTTMSSTITPLAGNSGGGGSSRSVVPMVMASASSSNSSTCSSTNSPLVSSLEETSTTRRTMLDSENSFSNNNNNNNDAPTNGGLKVLFLSSDTGGGHRASAESLGKQFQILFPGTTYSLLDVVEEDFGPPFNSLVSLYKHLSAHPTQWKLLYTVSNSRGFEMLADAHFKICFERAIRKSIRKYNPDVVVSVHPMMTNVPVLSCRKISHETGRHLPMFTVVTDLGSAHCLWFANGVEKMFVGSEQVKALAKARGKVSDEKLVMAGLPIRHDFAIQAELLGDRMSAEGRAYQQYVRGPKVLNLPCVDRKTLLVMGGGDGVGSLSKIVDALYVELVSQGINALILVVCGRNEKLKKSLDERDWVEVLENWNATTQQTGGMSKKLSYGYLRDSCGGGESIIPTTGSCIQGTTNVTGSIHRILSSGTLGMSLGSMSLASMSLGNMMSTPTPTAATEGSSSKRQSPRPSMTMQSTNLSKVAPAMEEKKADDASAAFAASEPIEAILTEYAIDIERDHNSLLADNSDSAEFDSLKDKTPGQVHVMGLGFVDRMAEFMVAADVLISKAGPGTISEAAALSLPIMLTSFLPGQEEGNIDFVTDAGFGAYVHDSDPIGVAEEVCMWLTNDAVRAKLCQAAKVKGMPHAARDIVQEIGDITLKWREINAKKQNEKVLKGKTIKESTTRTKEEKFPSGFKQEDPLPADIQAEASCM